MTPLAVLHVHQPKVSQSLGACRVCDLPLGRHPVLVQSSKGSEWICSSCMDWLSGALTLVGPRRVRAFVNGGQA